MKWMALFFFAKTALSWTLVSPSLHGWNRFHLQIHFNPSQCRIEETHLKNLLDASIDAWNGVPFAFITVERNPQNSLSSPEDLMAKRAPDVPWIGCDPKFSTSLSVDGDRIAGTAVALSGSDGYLTYGGILLNAEETATARVDNLSDGQLMVVLAHEIGHVLGLGHSSSEEALMYFSIAKKTKGVLTEDDMDGLSYLYPKNDFLREPFGCASVHGSTSAKNLSWLLPLLILVMTLKVGRRFLRSNKI